MNYKTLTTVVVLTFIMATQGLSQSSTEEVKKAIQSNFQKMGAAMSNGDAAALALHFTKDALLKFPDQPPIKGRKGVEEVHVKFLEQGISVKPTTEEVQRFGDLAYETGTYQLIATGGKVIDSGYYLTIWKKVGNQWKIHRDMISSINPKKE